MAAARNRGGPRSSSSVHTAIPRNAIFSVSATVKMTPWLDSRVTPSPTSIPIGSRGAALPERVVRTFVKIGGAVS